MIHVQNITVAFGGNSLFEDVSFLINHKERIGLTGKNGAGKSTLLKFLAGKQDPDNGKIVKMKGLTAGYLAQEITVHTNHSVMEEAKKAFDDLNDSVKLAGEITQELSDRTDYESEAYLELIEKLHDLNERIHLLGGHQSDAEAEKVLLGLGFERDDFNKPCNTFSGGWRMRIELAKILLRQPDLMLLDEPTNHLDIDSIQWLENFLKDYHGAIVMVSHDKLFLDRVTNRTIEISMGRIYDYKTNYSNYLKQRNERRQQLLNAQKNQQKYIEHTQELIDKFRAKKNKAAFAQSLIKKLDKLEIVEVDDEDLTGIHFRFPPAPHSGKVVIKTENLSKYYDEKEIFSDVNIEIERKEKVALVGRNGEGKSTFVKIIAGVTPFTGKVETGHQVKTGYFAQNQAEELDENKTVFQTIDDIASGEIRKNVRNLLGAFLFSGDTIDKKVKVLSGGEKNRLALCKLLLEPYNLLLLDEPTNHLDMKSKDVLKQALLNYDGTLLIVSHDRDFLDGLTNKMYHFRQKTVKPFIGSISEFMEQRRISTMGELEKKVNHKSAENTTDRADSKADYQFRKNEERENRKLRSELERTERQITETEAKMAVITHALIDPENLKDPGKIREFSEEHTRLQKRIDELMTQWEHLSTLIETQHS